MRIQPARHSLLTCTETSRAPSHSVCCDHAPFGNVRSEFFREYDLDCPYARERLINHMSPATVYRDVDERDQISRARQAAETVSWAAAVGLS